MLLLLKFDLKAKPNIPKNKRLTQDDDNLTPKQENKMEKPKKLTISILKAVALAMAVTSVVSNILNVATVQVDLLFLGIGLFALSLAVLSADRE
jgi:hypothetical protein